MNSESYDRPKIPFFESCCHTILSGYLDQHGLQELQAAGLSPEVVYSNGKMTIDFGYWIEDFPRYRLMIGLGLLPEGRFNPERSIGLWYLLPEAKQEDWPFETEDQLRSLLEHIRDNVLPIYVEPLFKDVKLLRQAIIRWENERTARFDQQAAEERRKQAEAAFKAGRYETVVKIYEHLSPVDLTPTDHKRLELARKRLR